MSIINAGEVFARREQGIAVEFTYDYGCGPVQKRVVMTDTPPLLPELWGYLATYNRYGCEVVGEVKVRENLPGGRPIAFDYR